MPTRTQLKQKWDLKSAAKVDEIAIALFEAKSPNYTEGQEAQMYQVLQVMQAKSKTAAQVVAEFRQQEESSAPVEDTDNAAYAGAQEGIGGMQGDVVSAVLPAAVEAAVQSNVAFYQLTGALIGAPQIRQSDRVQAARNNLTAAFLSPWTGGNLAQQAHQLLQLRPDALAQMTSGDTISALPALLPQRAALPSIGSDE
ncbi:hypothetical protein HPC62_16145 [Thermoleptolyngbya sichuanensis A183]|uniref:Uncharacterized protein n=1 Tax=Thermoleptolyngbya sichuanensis A183 TaxID=2737172 RepID=A0A6M8B911_9CYAN|nr:hypothetical protein [Thermoleptolyngbya sichuanensis]QKD83524.1 hypothetical protein HPC62_16145 [Thermoleptolyngbya sichuanensis A183]